MKVDKKGKITIPKRIRDLYGLTAGVELVMNDYMEFDGAKIILRPKYICSACGKALSAELIERRACAECTPTPREIIYVY